MFRAGAVCASIFLALAAPSVADDGPPDGFTFAAGGDIIGPRGPLTDAFDTDFNRIATLFRDADVGIANLEGAIFDPATFTGFPAAETGGGYPIYPLTLAGELRRMGIALVAKANNHGTDWGPEGLLATLAVLDDAGVAQAGSGIGAAAAYAAALVDTPRGKAALVSTATTFPPMSTAGPPVTRFGIESSPRPGISTIRVRKIRNVLPGDLPVLAEIGGPIARAVPGRPDELRIDDQVFRASDSRGFAWEMNEDDVDAVLSSIRAASSQAAFTAFMIHSHETAGHVDDIPLADYEIAAIHRANEVPSPDDPRPAEFQPRLFHAAIDAGADAVIRTGPHSVGGIEIYRGRPIYYSLGSLFLLFCGDRTYTAPGGQVKTLPDEWYETVIPIARYDAGTLAEVRLHPAIIQSEPGPLCSVPRPAGPAEAQRILARIRELSVPFGTDVVIRGNVGVITPR